MNVRMRMQIVDDDGTVLADDTVLELDKPALQLEALGLSLAEAKRLLRATQERLLAVQAADHLARHRHCPDCGRVRASKGVRPIRFRTLFGTVDVPGRRLRHCACHPKAGRSFSPLTALVTQHVAPELQFLEAKWASLVSYGITADLLRDVLPVADATNPMTVRRDLVRIATRLEAVLGEEQHSFIEGSPADWSELPDPEGPIIVGMDGGFVRGWEDKTAQFEVIAGKSVPEDRADRFFGFVQTHDTKPRRRLNQVLRDQCLQMNQDVTFLTDGGDSVRALVAAMSPCAEHLLDWFHIAMRFTVLGQFAKGVAQQDAAVGADVTERLERIKWRLWHGDAIEAQERLEDLAEDLRALDLAYDGLKKFARLTAECAGYIANNIDAIPHYGERRRYGEPISTAFVESTVNVVIDKRMSKRQQMQWTKRGAHHLLQVRTRTLDGTLRPVFESWYPGLAANDHSSAEQIAA
ncbi:ISKra4 family transposase [Azorhizobium sp. AG788]|uniref:ISKra4 family transposase n=1 Tax=Azorhizobium sp. AG788 TaxID=2183897 RepID=UPI0031392A08